MTTTKDASQAVLEWTRAIPRQVTQSYTSSVTLMKQLTAIAISTVAYLKDAFPEDSYMDETFCGIKIKILKKKCRDEHAQFLTTALMQAYEAFDKRYLQQLVLCFYEDECKMDNLIEYHIFEYLYHGDGVTMKVHSKSQSNEKRSLDVPAYKYTFDDVKERTIHMIKSYMVCMQLLQNRLPKNFDISLRLYYNEDTPSDYQAPGYLFASDSEDHLEDMLASSNRVAWVETPYHKLVARAYVKDITRASNEAIASPNPPVMTQGDVEQTHHLSSEDEGTVDCDDETRMQCPCYMYDTTSNETDLLTCHYCGTLQHAACYGVLRAHAALVSRHCCAACHDVDPTRRATDETMAKYSAKQRKCLCIYRRTLQWCTQISTITTETLVQKFKISHFNAAKLMYFLKFNKIIAQHEEHEPQKVDAEHLKSAMSKYFKGAGDDNIVDRLLAETFASQESHSDPISDVLSPLEKVTLQNDFAVCRVIEQAESNRQTNEEDSTLKQYRDALSNDKCEEPASVASERGGRRRSEKRKVDEGSDKTESRFSSSGTTKRTRVLRK